MKRDSVLHSNLRLNLCFLVWMKGGEKHSCVHLYAEGFVSRKELRLRGNF